MDAIALVPNPEFSHLPTQDQITRTANALEANGFRVVVVESGDDARACVLAMIPPGAEVYNPPSRTLDEIGLTNDIETATSFTPVRLRLRTLDLVTQRGEMRRLTASPDVVVGSVHAITEHGQVLVASASGSQLSSAASGAGNVIWVVGVQKLVPTIEEGFRRIREYSYPLEDIRTRDVYGRPSAINKILVVNGEVPGRITIILVKQNLGF